MRDFKRSRKQTSPSLQVEHGERQAPLAMRNVERIDRFEVQRPAQTFPIHQGAKVGPQAILQAGSAGSRTGAIHVGTRHLIEAGRCGLSKVFHLGKRIFADFHLLKTK